MSFLSAKQTDLLQVIGTAGDRLRFDEPMARHTTFQVGGYADAYFEPANEDEIVRAVTFCRQQGWSCTLLGNGSNILVSDRGIRGLVLIIGERLAGIDDHDGGYYVRAGTRLAGLAAFAAKNSQTGLEFASGIPGTFGGAILMNAGAYGGCMADVVQETVYFDRDLQKRKAVGSEQRFAYRSSLFSDQEAIILGARITLKPEKQALILARMADLAGKRRQSQPLDLPSAGSIFRRPPDHFAGKLISDCQLKGLRIGSAQVSEKHAGFIVNLGQATAWDVRALISRVQQVVADQTGVVLEPEIRFIGDWQSWPEPARHNRLESVLS